MPPKAKTATKSKAPVKRKLAEEFPIGEVLTDMAKKQWKLGAPVGQGGFGLLYLADQNSEKPVKSDAPYVIKVEPSENGPLFSELKFYMRVAKPDQNGPVGVLATGAAKQEGPDGGSVGVDDTVVGDVFATVDKEGPGCSMGVQTWTKSRKLKNLGVPRYWGSGLHEKGGMRYRFMVIDRLGIDLQKKFEACGKIFPRKLVLQLGLRLLDILEYIHEHEYVHADIKASNLMLHYKDPNQVYLADYGLAYRYAPGGVLKDYKEDPKRCHDGTIEYTSINAHNGAASCRRCDMEILGYCMVQWLCGRLPWEDNLQDPLHVRDSKKRFLEDIPSFMSQCFSSENKPGEIQKFLEEVKALGYQDKPPYGRLRAILQQGLTKIHAKDDDKLDFPVDASASTSSKKGTKRKKPITVEDEGSDERDGTPVRKKKLANKRKDGVKKTKKL